MRYIFVAAFLFCYIYIDKTPLELIVITIGAVYLLMSSVTFILYGWDKSAARRGATRISERTLLNWALFGGWFGALIAQQIFRHKTHKATFKRRLTIVIWINATFASPLITMGIPSVGHTLYTTFSHSLHHLFTLSHALP